MANLIENMTYAMYELV